jgi:hypothetical protein
MAKMTELGMKRKENRPGEDLCAQPADCESYEDEVIYPELHAEGEQAAMLGSDDLEEGDIVEQTVRWKCKRSRRVEENGKVVDRSLVLCMIEASDMEQVGRERKKESAEDDSVREEDSPAMAFIRSRAAEE